MANGSSIAEWLLNLVAEHPDLTLDEVAAAMHNNGTYSGSARVLSGLSYAAGLSCESLLARHLIGERDGLVWTAGQ